MPIRKDLLGELMKDSKSPEDLLGEAGLLDLRGDTKDRYDPHSLLAFLFIYSLIFSGFTALPYLRNPKKLVSYSGYSVTFIGTAIIIHKSKHILEVYYHWKLLDISSYCNMIPNIL